MVVAINGPSCFARKQMPVKVWEMLWLKILSHFKEIQCGSLSNCQIWKETTNNQVGLQRQGGLFDIIEKLKVQFSLRG